MPTAVCNCPADIGWLPETSWPYGSGCAGQPIYCQGGDPVVPPRPLFQAQGDARVDATVGSLHAWLPGGTVGSPTILTPANYPGIVVAPMTITNNSCYPMRLMYHAVLDLHMVLAANGPGLPGQIIWTVHNVVVSGGIADNVTGQVAVYGNEVGSGGGFGLNPCFRQQSFTWPIPALLPPGAAATFTPQIGYYFDPGSGLGPIATTGIFGLTSAVRVWGDNA